MPPDYGRLCVCIFLCPIRKDIVEITNILWADGDPDQQKDLRKSAVAPPTHTHNTHTSPRSYQNSFFSMPLFFPCSACEDYFKQLGRPLISKARMEEEGKEGGGGGRKTAASF